MKARKQCRVAQTLVGTDTKATAGSGTLYTIEAQRLASKKNRLGTGGSHPGIEGPLRQQATKTVTIGTVLRHSDPKPGIESSGMRLQDSREVQFGRRALPQRTEYRSRQQRDRDGVSAWGMQGKGPRARKIGLR